MVEVKEEREKVGLKLNIQKTKILASGPISSWQVDGEKVETVTDFILGGSKITADGNCNYDKSRQRMKKDRHCIADKRPSSQSYGFANSHI